MVAAAEKRILAGRLWRAAALGETNAVKALIGLGAGIGPNPWRGGRTPLHAAVRSGRKACMRALLSAGCDVDAADDKGHTPLRAAVELRDTATLKFLLRTGCDVDAADVAGGYAPLHRALELRDTPCVKLLLRAGASLEAKTSSPPGWQALHCAISSDYDANFDLVMARGPDVLACTSDAGWTPLNMAAEEGNAHMVKKLLRAGALPDAETFTKVHGSADCMEALALAGVRITQKDADWVYRADRWCLLGLPGRPKFCDLINGAVRGTTARLELLRDRRAAPSELEEAAAALEALQTSRQRVEARDRAEMGHIFPDE